MPINFVSADDVAAFVDRATSDPAPPGGCDRGHAVATFFALVNSHCYQFLAAQLGWSQADWQQPLIAVLDRELLGTSQPNRTPLHPR